MSRKIALSIFVLIAFVTFATGPPIASALEYPGERLANNATVNELVVLGENYWHARGVQPCATPIMYFADALDDYHGENAVGKTTSPPSCTIWLRVDYFAWAQDHPTDKAASWSVCVLVIHELGHTAGLEHSKDPLSPMYWKLSTIEVPWDCRVWARDRAVVKRHVRKSSRARVGGKVRSDFSP